MKDLFEDLKPEKRGEKESAERWGERHQVGLGGQQQPEHVIGHAEDFRFDLKYNSNKKPVKGLSRGLYIQICF